MLPSYTATFEYYANAAVMDVKGQTMIIVFLYILIRIYCAAGYWFIFMKITFAFLINAAFAADLSAQYSQIINL